MPVGTLWLSYFWTPLSLINIKSTQQPFLFVFFWGTPFLCRRHLQMPPTNGGVGPLDSPPFQSEKASERRDVNDFWPVASLSLVSVGKSILCIGTRGLHYERPLMMMSRPKRPLRLNVSWAAQQCVYLKTMQGGHFSYHELCFDFPCGTLHIVTTEQKRTPSWGKSNVVHGKSIGSYPLQSQLSNRNEINHIGEED